MTRSSPDFILTDATAALEGEGRALFLFTTGTESVRSAVALRRSLPTQYHRVRTVDVSCASTSGQVWPVVERRITRQRRALSTAIRILAHWLAAAPIIGPIAGAISDSIEALLNKRKPPLLFSARPTAEAVRNVLTESAQAPLIIHVAALECADADDLAGLHLLLRGIRATRTLLLLQVDGLLAQQSPHLRNLILEAEYNGSARVFSATGSGAAAASGAGVDDLASRDLELLTLAAQEGEVFHGVTLARLAHRDELEIEDELARLARAGYIRAVEQPAAEAEKSSRYQFVSPELAQRLGASA